MGVGVALVVHPELRFGPSKRLAGRAQRRVGLRNRLREGMQQAEGLRHLRRLRLSSKSEQERSVSQTCCRVLRQSRPFQQ